MPEELVAKAAREENGVAYDGGLTGKEQGGICPTQTQGERPIATAPGAVRDGVWTRQGW